jgi:hypothetical protein
MKVEFDNEEVHEMFSAIVDELVDLKLSRSDRAAIRRWRADDMKPGSPAVALLTQKVNEALQRQHERAEVSPIKKPDWAT